MTPHFLNALAEYGDLNESDIARVRQTLEYVAPALAEVRDRTAAAQLRVLQAFQRHEVADFHLNGSTGYGYGDSGRAKLEAVWAELFKGEAALVRGHMVSGTHAIASVLFGLLRSGQELLSVSGMPYDTLQTIIGETGDEPGTLKEYGVRHRVIDLGWDGDFDIPAILEAIGPETGLVAIQRSRGYDWRKSLTIAQIERVAKAIRAAHPEVPIFVDNCYGEFVEEKEPLEVGADIIAGSLIKNPGGALAPRGGYVCGRQDLIDRVASRLTAPGIAHDVGAALDFNRPAFQGLFMAPLIVEQALSGAIFAAAYLESLGYAVSPGPLEYRTDIIQAVRFAAEAPLMRFAEGIQMASPLESYVRPVASPLPGYDDQVVMAGGTFTQGSSIELSVDAPLRPPYIGYMQGGLSFAHVVTAVTCACKRMEA